MCKVRVLCVKDAVIATAHIAKASNGSTRSRSEANQPVTLSRTRFELVRANHSTDGANGIQRWGSFSATNAPQNGAKDRLHQTEHPNALPASWRCPGSPYE